MPLLGGQQAFHGGAEALQPQQRLHLFAKEHEVAAASAPRVRSIKAAQIGRRELAGAATQVLCASHANMTVLLAARMQHRPCLKWHERPQPEHPRDPQAHLADCGSGEARRRALGGGGGIFQSSLRIPKLQTHAAAVHGATVGGQAAKAMGSSRGPTGAAAARRPVAHQPLI